MTRVRHVEKITAKHLRGAGGMNYPAAVATKSEWPAGFPKSGVLIAETRRSRVGETIDHEIHERDLMRRGGRPYTLEKYREAHRRTEEWERRRKK